MMRGRPARRPLRSRRWYVDAALSCTVYLIPLVGPQWVWLTGEYVLVSPQWRAEQSRDWALAELAVLALAQLGLFSVLRLTRRRSVPIAAALGLITLGLLTPALNVLLLATLPARYLIEHSEEPARNALREVCVLENIDLIPQVPTVYPRDESAAMFVRRLDDQRLAALDVPACVVAPTPVPGDANVFGSATSGSVLWTQGAGADSRPGAWVVTMRDGQQFDIEPGVVSPGVFPRLLDDGRSLAWVEGGIAPQIVVLDAAAAQALRRIKLPPRSWTLFGGSGGSGPFHASASDSGEVRWFLLNESGRPIRSVADPTIFARFGHRLVVLSDGWVGWDTYVEHRRYMVAWSRGGTLTRRELPKGMTITSIAIDADGAFVAVSATSGVNVGTQRDEVWLVRTSDGAELFRRYAPKYSRASVALPTGRFFAVSDLDGDRPVVRIYALPEP